MDVKHCSWKKATKLKGGNVTTESYYHLWKVREYVFAQKIFLWVFQNESKEFFSYRDNFKANSSCFSK